MAHSAGWPQEYLQAHKHIPSLGPARAPGPWGPGGRQGAGGVTPPKSGARLPIDFIPLNTFPVRPLYYKDSACTGFMTF